jgi:predicted adenylyl cyclase CyaB
MRIINLEIKARCTDPGRVRCVLRSRNARIAGTDHQIDTYFRVQEGRLKLREGTIENALIYYQRPNQGGPKTSNVLLHKLEPNSGLKAILTEVLGVLAVVDKQREIYYVDNVKIHIDSLHSLGNFVEIEAAGDEKSDREKLRAQCEEFMRIFGVAPSDLLEHSYSDMILALSS